MLDELKIALPEVPNDLLSSLVSCAVHQVNTSPEGQLDRERRREERTSGAHLAAGKTANGDDHGENLTGRLRLLVR